MATEKSKNIPIQISGKEYLITPLSAQDFAKIVPQGLCATDVTTEVIGILVKLAHAALLPNYPDMTLEKVAEILHFDKDQSLVINDEEIANAITAANETIRTILKLSSQTWNWDSRITKH